MRGGLSKHVRQGSRSRGKDQQSQHGTQRRLARPLRAHPVRCTSGFVRSGSIPFLSPWATKKKETVRRDGGEGPFSKDLTTRPSFRSKSCARGRRGREKRRWWEKEENRDVVLVLSVRFVLLDRRNVDPPPFERSLLLGRGEAKGWRKSVGWRIPSDGW